jgi:uncharacterized protein YqjF (DUF2071 family)
MRWHDLLFAHWRVDPARLRAHVPAELDLDAFDGSGWLGIVPFRMSGVRPRCLPPLPRWSAFPELNVRTYVVRDGRPGVWFFSLDAAEPPAVRVARRTFGLEYLHARMACEPEPDGAVRYRSVRTDRRAPAAELACRYRPIDGVFHAAPGSLEHFLTARDCLYARDRAGTLRRGEIDHAPWPLQAAAWEVERCDMTRIAGVELPADPPHLLFARHLSVRAWLPVRC